MDRQALPGRNFRFELEPRNVFVGQSARLIRSLLTGRDRVWAQSELVTRARASSGLVSDAQTCLDLQATGLRGPDQAAALRQWKGFCRP